jgi:Caspase domain
VGDAGKGGVVRFVVILVAALLALAPAGARAEKRVALVIGNSAYRNTPALPNPRNDAAAIAEALSRLGFAVQSGIDLDRAATEQALRAFGGALGDADVALFYYAGHGLQVDTRNYLVRSMPGWPRITTCPSRPSTSRWCCR